MFDTIVLATDGSESADRAVELALDLADRFDAALHACYVLDTDTPSRETADTALATITDRDPDVTTTVREGSPADEICAFADELDADLVVTGTRGRDGEHGNLLGSVAEAVVSRSPAPVLTARQLDADGDIDVPVPNGGA